MSNNSGALHSISATLSPPGTLQRPSHIFHNPRVIIPGSLYIFPLPGPIVYPTCLVTQLVIIGLSPPHCVLLCRTWAIGARGKATWPDPGVEEITQRNICVNHSMLIVRHGARAYIPPINRVTLVVDLKRRLEFQRVDGFKRQSTVPGPWHRGQEYPLRYPLPSRLHTGLVHTPPLSLPEHTPARKISSISRDWDHRYYQSCGSDLLWLCLPP